jgi:Flp pilus assembly protein TadG
LRGVKILILNLFHRLRKDDRGAELVEFAIVVLVFLTIVFGIIEFGWIFHGYVTLTGAAREGLRLAVVMETDNTEEIKGAVIEHARIFNLNPGDISITPNPAVYDQERTITVSGDLDLLIFPGSITLPVSATMRHERN